MISLIIPTLNEGKTLPKLLNCFPPHLRQRFDLEVIVSDGGSTDRTADIAHQAGARLVQHTAGTPQTIGEARNLGAAHARGEVLVFLDADSVVPQTELFLQQVTEVMRERTTVAASVDITIAPAERRWVDTFWQGLFNLVFRWSNALGLGTGRGNCQIVRHIAFATVGGYNERLAAGEDADLFHRLTRLGRITFLKNVVVYESPRRFRRLGYLRTVLLWNLNYLNVLFTKRSWSKRWHRVD